MGLTRSEALKIMGLEEGCSSKDVRERFKKLALKWHPDKNLRNPDEAQKKFQAISAAYTKLVSTEDVYDEIPTSTLREMFAEIWGAHNRGRRQFEGSPHLFCDCDVCQAQWEDVNVEDFIGSDSDLDDDDLYYMDDTLYADGLLKDFADKLYRNFNSPGRAGKKTRSTWTSSGYRKQTVTAEEALRNADELLKAEEEEKRQAEKKKQKNKKKKESKKRRKAKQKDDDEGSEKDKKDEIDEEAEVKDKEEDGVDEEKGEEPLKADGVLEEAGKKEEEGKAEGKEEDEKEEAGKAVNVVKDDEEEEEEPVLSEDEIDFTSAFVKHAKDRATSKSKETAAADNNESHSKRSKGQKPKSSDSGPHRSTSSHQRPKSSSKHGTKYGTVFKSREGSSVVDSSSGLEINGTVPVVSAANGYEPASEEEDDLSPTDMSEAVLYQANIPKSRQLAGEGNRAAKSGEFEEAVQKYSEAIRLYPFDHRYFGNRSFCYDYLHEYSKALGDANSALKIDSSWAKGYYRRGRALAGLQRYEGAVKAFAKALQLDPQYTDASEQLEAVQLEHLQSMGYSVEASAAALAEYGSVQAAMDAMATRKSGGGQKRQHPPPSPPSLPSPKEYTPVYNNSGFEIPPRMLSTLVPSQGCALWVGNVNSRSITQQVLTKLFQRHGQVASVRVLHDRRCAFVNYYRPESAAIALKKLQGYHIGGSYLLIRYPDNISKPPPVAAPVQKSKKAGPVNGDECYFWRTTGCAFGSQCRFRHLPESRGVDAADMSSGSPSQ